MPPAAPRARDQHPRVRFAPTPEEEQLWEWAGSLRRAALRAILWPLLLPGQLQLAAEALLARALGVFGSLYAATAIAKLLLSRGGLKRLLFGLDHSAVNSGALAAALTAAAASAPATEPAVPQPLTPPPVAAGADAFASSPDWPAVPAVPSPAVQPEGVQPHSQHHPALAAAYAHALAQAPADTPVPGPPSVDAAVADWQQDLAAAAAAAAGAAGGGFAGSAAAAAALAAAAAERGGAAEAADEEGTGGGGREGGGPAAVLSWQQLQAKKAELRALRDREERLLAAFEPAGPQAQQAAAAWLQGSEALLATASSAELAAAASAAAANLSGTAGSEGRGQLQQQAAIPSAAAGGSPAAASPAQQQKKAETEIEGKEAPVAAASSARLQASRGSASGLHL
ncbi:hypothetical protein D9Q98_002454 [Chlorella vulgaris]|uniref:Uncharacterized protein n=1 Tax=Chlorella vulgaris TaxID=3077 RepID=A0A9D4YZD0_CHLVU|nr:hypothetical protein D9Q98_002454 [Chlorella vulgaris]